MVTTASTLGVIEPTNPNKIINTLPPLGRACSANSIPVVSATAGPIAVTGTFNGISQSGGVTVFGDYNVTISGTFVGTVAVQRQFAGDPTWYTVTQGGFTLQYTGPVSEIQSEPEANVAYRLACTAYTSGSIKYRLSQ